jgi:DNA (cytosine-5)-methyltransferase 1
LVANPDLAVLKTENQNPTHVTPRIAALAEGFVREELVVVGPPPVRNKDLLQLEKKEKAHDHLCRLIAKAKKEIKDIDYKKEDRVSVHSEFYKAVEVDKEIYRVCMIFFCFLIWYFLFFWCLSILEQIGDVVLIPNDTKARWEHPELQRSQKIRIPPDAQIDDFFW